MKSYDKPWLDKKDKAAKLCRAVDKSCLSFETFLIGRNVKPEIVARAKSLDRQRDLYIKNIVLNMGGSWNGERLEETKPVEETPKPKRKKRRTKKERRKWASPTTEALFTGRKVSLILKDRNKK